MTFYQRYLKGETALQAQFYHHALRGKLYRQMFLFLGLPLKVRLGMLHFFKENHHTH